MLQHGAGNRGHIGYENVRFILLMRHGKHAEAVQENRGLFKHFGDALAQFAGVGGLFRTTSTRVLTEEGSKETVSVAKRLREHQQQAEDGLRLAGIIHAPSDEARLTAEEIKKSLPKTIGLGNQAQEIGDMPMR